MDALFEKFPEFRKAYDERVEVDVFAGESIYIPPHVWHYVETDEFCEYFPLHDVF
jgi:mannose-6-phosphate isomerase-like protein (cupin superfamily)